MLKLPWRVESAKGVDQTAAVLGKLLGNPAWSFGTGAAPVLRRDSWNGRTDRHGNVLTAMNKDETKLTLFFFSLPPFKSCLAKAIRDVATLDHHDLLRKDSMPVF